MLLLLRLMQCAYVPMITIPYEAFTDIIKHNRPMHGRYIVSETEENQVIVENSMLNQNVYIHAAYNPGCFVDEDADGYLGSVRGKPPVGNVKIVKGTLGYFIYVNNKQMCYKMDGSIQRCSVGYNASSMWQIVKVGTGYMIKLDTESTEGRYCLTIVHDVGHDDLEMLPCLGIHRQVFKITRYPNLDRFSLKRIPDEFIRIRESLFEISADTSDE